MLASRGCLALPVLLGLFVLTVYLFTFPNDIQGNGDTWLRYETTQSMIDNSTINYSEFGTPTWTDKRVIHGVNNKLYTIYDPGQIVAMMPGYIIGKFLAHHITNDYVWTPRYTSFTVDEIFGALIAIVFFLLALRLGYSRKVAALLTLIFAFASVAWPDAESFLEHAQVSFFLSLAVLLTITFVQEGMLRRRWIIASALALGGAFLTRYDTGILFPLIPLYLAAARIALKSQAPAAAEPAQNVGSVRLALRLARESMRDIHVLRGIILDWTVYLLALVPVFAAAAWWNYSRFGSPIKTGIPPTFGEPILQGLSGLLVSPGKGIIWYMPIVFVLPFVIAPFYRRHKLITVFFASIVVVELLLFSNVIYWHGDPAWGPRYIFPTAPYLVLPLGMVLERWMTLGAWARRAFVGVVVLSLAIQVAAVVAPPYRFWYQQIHAQLVARQGWNWGQKDGKFWYFYYWNVPENPILNNFANLYQITALRVFGANQYNLQASPIPNYEHLNLANPVHTYEINNYNIWWLSKMHPFLGTRKDMLLAALLLLFGTGTFVLLRRELDEDPLQPRVALPDLEPEPSPA